MKFNLNMVKYITKLKNFYQKKFFNSVVINNGKNNVLNIFDLNGKKTDLKYIENLEICFEGNNATVNVFQNLNLKHKTKIILKNNSILDIGNTDWQLNFSVYAFISDFSVLKIGNNVSCGYTIFYICDEPNMNITIDDNCMLSSGIIFRSSDAHSIIDNETNNVINHSENIYVGKNVWIGQNSMILKGASIPPNSVLGAGCVYTRKSYPTENQAVQVFQGGVFAGNPAKLIKKNITWSRQKPHKFIKYNQGDNNEYKK